MGDNYEKLQHKAVKTLEVQTVSFPSFLHFLGEGGREGIHVALPHQYKTLKHYKKLSDISKIILQKVLCFIFCKS